MTLALVATITAMAQTHGLWTDYADENWGNDYPTNDYYVSTPQQLAKLAVMVNQGMDFQGSTIRLTKSIDLSAHYWVPIGNGATTVVDAKESFNSFLGTFDGNYKSISGLKVGTATESCQYAGLFGVMELPDDAEVTIKNLTLSKRNGSHISHIVAAGTDDETVFHAGAFIAAAVADDSGVYLSLENCTNEIPISITSGYHGQAGGLIGSATFEEGAGAILIIKGINKATISGSGEIGGIAGFITTPEGVTHIEQSINSGKITSLSSSYFQSLAGGMIGYGTTTDNIMITSSHNYGDVTSGDAGEVSASGGILGQAEGTVQIYDTTNSGTIQAGNDGGVIAAAGGIVGGSGEGELSIGNCYNRGDIIGGGGAFASTGGIVGGGTKTETTLVQCRNTASVTGGHSEWFTLTGGIAGGFVGKASSIRNCINSGNIEAGDGTESWFGKIGIYAGGLVGQLDGEESHIGSSLNLGNIRGYNRTNEVALGGLLGKGEGLISDAYSYATITAPHGYIGGVAGYFGSFEGTDEIRSVYAAGALRGGATAIVGGVVGNLGNDNREDTPLISSSLVFLDELKGATANRIIGTVREGMGFVHVPPAHYAYGWIDNYQTMTGIENGTTWTGEMDNAPIDGWNNDIWNIDPTQRFLPKLTVLGDANPDILNRTLINYIEFNSQGGSDVASQQIFDGDVINRPEEPTRRNYAFTGWFTSPSGGELWDFDTPVAENITLYAGWITSIAASFVLVDGIPTQVYKGMPLTPEPLLRHNNNFLKEGTDYALTYENNDKPGEALITITGLGRYGGKRQLAFQIVADSDSGGDPTDVGAVAEGFTLTMQQQAITIDADRAATLTIIRMDGVVELVRDIPTGTTTVDLLPGSYLVRVDNRVWKVLVSR